MSQADIFNWTLFFSCLSSAAIASYHKLNGLRFLLKLLQRTECRTLPSKPLNLLCIPEVSARHSVPVRPVIGVSSFKLKDLSVSFMSLGSKLLKESLTFSLKEAVISSIEGGLTV